MNLEKIPDDRLLAYSLTVASLVVPGLTLIIVKNFSFFSSADATHLVMLGGIISFPFYIVNFLVSAFVGNYRKLMGYRFYTELAIKTIAIVYFWIGLEFSLVYFFGGGLITDYFQLVLVFVISSVVLSLGDKYLLNNSK